MFLRKIYLLYNNFVFIYLSKDLRALVMVYPPKKKIICSKITDPGKKWANENYESGFVYFSFSSLQGWFVEGVRFRVVEHRGGLSRAGAAP